MNDIDYILEQIEKEENESAPLVQTEIPKKDLTVVRFGESEISIDDEDALMAEIFNSALEDKKQSDKLYQFYVERIELDRDRSDSVREGLSKAVELRQNSTSNLIKLLDMKKKYSKAAVQGNSLVSLNLTQRDTGINIKDLTSEILNG